MNRVVHFEIHVDDMDRAQKFYEQSFGWKFQNMGDKFGGYRVIATGPGPDELLTKKIDLNDWGINGGMMKRNAPKPAEGMSPMGAVTIVSTDDIDATIAKVEAAGGKQHMKKDMVPGVGWLAYYADTEGNVFGVIQPEMPMPKQK